MKILVRQIRLMVLALAAMALLGVVADQAIAPADFRSRGEIQEAQLTETAAAKPRQGGCCGLRCRGRSGNSP